MTCWLACYTPKKSVEAQEYISYTHVQKFTAPFFSPSFFLSFSIPDTT